MARHRLKCPSCGVRLPYDRKALRNGEGETVRIRECGCGYWRQETVTENWKEYFPESTPLPVAEHPGEGGYGPAKRG